ncbi:hypothetical protein BKA58DRAFT_310606 [Alternaria rosae]|uniref:uncharacterized protein n=1 Tax=Alternaria rosae TaxID=1187941 RepID=UPI001E8DFC8B|nr:uncharacterized protein BKA58DRAFT_310606 [Alternaria rosae]KAH6875152.1 hypothetical protein BKA58DRAFT_310606 [Alternaria rosae]
MKHRVVIYLRYQRRSSRPASSTQYQPAANQRNSPLLRLPAELRNRIYLYTFDINNIHLIHQRRDRRGPRNSPYPMSLAQSCTQCRYEALPYFW